MSENEHLTATRPAAVRPTVAVLSLAILVGIAISAVHFGPGLSSGRYEIELAPPGDFAFKTMEANIYIMDTEGECDNIAYARVTQVGFIKYAVFTGMRFRGCPF